jgi:hypothetical protein
VGCPAWEAAAQAPPASAVAGRGLLESECQESGHAGERAPYLLASGSCSCANRFKVRGHPDNQVKAVANGKDSLTPARQNRESIAIFTTGFSQRWLLFMGFGGGWGYITVHGNAVNLTPSVA